MHKKPEKQEGSPMKVNDAPAYGCLNTIRSLGFMSWRDQVAQEELVDAGQAVYLYRNGRVPTKLDLTRMLSEETTRTMEELGADSLGELMLRTVGPIDVIVLMMMAVHVAEEDDISIASHARSGTA